MLAANAGGRGFESHRGHKICLSFYSIRVQYNEKNCFVKLILNYQS